MIQTVPDDELIGAFEADEIGLDGHLAFVLLVEKDADADGMGGAVEQHGFGVRKRPPRFENVVDQNDRPIPDPVGDVMHDLDVARAFGGFAVTRQGQKIDLRLDAGLIESAYQVGREDEAALQNRNQQQIRTGGGSNLARQLGNALCDLFLREQGPHRALGPHAARPG